MAKINLSFHPLYLKEIKKINQSYLAYDNNPDFINEDTLYRHRREDKEDYNQRRKRAYRINYYKYLVDLFFKAIFNRSRGVSREINDEYKEYQNDIDLQNNNIDTFMSQVGKHALLGRQCYIWVDQDINGRPNARIIPFQQVINWSLDNNNNLEWIIIQLKKNISSPFANDKDKVEILYVLYTKEKVYIADANGNITKETVNKLNAIPIVVASIWDYNTDGFGEALYQSLLPLDIEIMNTVSLYQTELYLNLFNILCIPYTGNPDSIKTIINEHSYISVDADAKIPPSYVNPDTKTFIEKRDYISFLINEMLRICGFKNDKDPRPISGVAKLYDFISTNETLGIISYILQNIECDMWYNFYSYRTNNPNYEEFAKLFAIKYPDTFDPINVKEEIMSLNELISLDYSKIASKEAKKIVIKKTIEDYVPKQVIINIENEIDNEIEENIKEVNDENLE